MSKKTLSFDTSIDPSGVEDGLKNLEEEVTSWAQDELFNSFGSIFQTIMEEIFGDTAIYSVASGIISSLVLLDSALSDIFVKESEAVIAARATAETYLEAANAAQERNQSYERLSKAQADSAMNSSAEMEYLKGLTTELYSLVDSKGRVLESDKSRVAFILNQLNGALGTEYELVSNQISGYENLKEVISAQIESKKAELMLAAMEPEYLEAISEKKNLMTEQLKNEIQMRETSARVIDLEREKKALMEEYDQEISKNEGERNIERTNQLQTRLQEVQAMYDAEVSSLDSLSKAHVANEEQLELYYQNISDYETLYGLMLEGKTGEVCSFLEERNAAILNSEDIARLSKDEQLKILSEQASATSRYVQKLKEDYSNGVNGVTEQMIKDAEAQAILAQNAFEEVGVGITDGVVDGATSKESEEAIKGAMEGVVENAKDGLDGDATWPGMYTTGWNAGKALMDGAAGATKSPSAQNVWSSYYTAGKNAASWFARGAGCASPSKLTRKTGVNIVQGAELGLQDEAPKLFNQAAALGQGLAARFGGFNTSALAAKMRAAVARSASQVFSGVSAGASYRISTNPSFQGSAEAGSQSPQTIQNHISIDGREFAIVTTPYIEEELAYR